MRAMPDQHPRRPKLVTLRLSSREQRDWGEAADRERLTLKQWLRAAAELAIARGSTR